MEEKQIISFNITTTVIIYIITAILLWFVNHVLCYIFSGISFIHILYFYIIGNKLKKLYKNGLVKKDS